MGSVFLLLFYEWQNARRICRKAEAERQNTWGEIFRNSTGEELVCTEPSTCVGFRFNFFSSFGSSEVLPPHLRSSCPTFRAWLTLTCPFMPFYSKEIFPGLPAKVKTFGHKALKNSTCLVFRVLIVIYIYEFINVILKISNCSTPGLSDSWRKCLCLNFLPRLYPQCL